PITRDVHDAALVLGAMAGVDPLDATSVDEPVPDYVARLQGGVKGMKLGVPREYFGEGVDPEVERAVRAAIDRLRDLGTTIEDVSLPTTDYGLAVYYIVAPAEASSNLARYDGVKYGLRAPGGKDLIDMESRTRAAGFGAEVKRRIMLGTYALSAGYHEAYYGRAQKVRTLVKRDFAAAFAKVDLLVGPTTPSVAFRHGGKEDPLAMYLNDVYTVGGNLAGLPAVSIRCGFSDHALPIGLQIIGRPFDEARVLRAAYAYEQATDWLTRRPELG
ncbi:MAG: aspartyl/glutamyl-tRNA amidotransferase subunit A, partial [Candidatus Rokubacteria bacterium]|nr:aspartyl/glutamyl-tRNA amidotransferase subunit A [Candidatus Rokubacteria bacterium]